MTRPTLSIARAPKAPRRPSYSLVKRAIRLFRGKGVPKPTYRRNALAWLAANASLGDKHLLRGQVQKGNTLAGRPASWGVPGEPGIDQVYAPRRFGGR